MVSGLYICINSDAISDEGIMASGKVKWFDGKKGYGFIVPAEGEGDVFVHYSAIKSESEFRTLKEGVRVEFEVAEGKKGLQALNVVVVP